MSDGSRVRPARVLMLGNYDINLYSRGRILYKGLKQEGIPTELFLPRGFWKNAYLLFRLFERDFDVLIVNGKPALLLSWLTKWIHGSKILFDVFISDFDTLVFDRKVLAPTSLRAKFYWWFDRFCCRKADFNILDTEEHVDYFVDEFGLPTERFGVIPVGADDQVFMPTTAPGGYSLSDADRPLLVHFHGTYIPLQGVEHIIQAANLLRQEHIRFRLIGSGQEHRRIRTLAERLQLRNVEFIDLVPLEELPKAIAAADVCLGAFGTSGKAQRVITNKCYEALAMGKPLITGRTPASEHYLKDGAMLVEPGDPKALAAAILTLKRNPALRADLSRRGTQLFHAKLSIRAIAKLTLQYLTPLLPGGTSLIASAPRDEDLAPPKRKILIPKPKVIREPELVSPSIPEGEELSEGTVGEPVATDADTSTVEIVEESVAETVPERIAHTRPARTPKIEVVEKPIESSKRRTETPNADPKFLQKLDGLFARAIAAQRKPKSIESRPAPRPVTPQITPGPKPTLRQAPRQKKRPVRKTTSRKKRRSSN